MQPAKFDWKITGRATVIDHGAIFASDPRFLNLMELGAFSVITFDPAGRLHGEDQLKTIDEFQIISHAILGDGENTTLYACLDPTMSATLEPLPDPETRVLAQVPMGTVALDGLTELDAVDWLLLDARNNNMAALDNGVATLDNALLIQVRVPFLKTHCDQADIADICQWMANHGFQCYRLDNSGFNSRFDRDLELEKNQATQLASMDAIFVPTEQRLTAMHANKLTKLAFLLDTIHGIHDFTHDLLARVDTENAAAYLSARGYTSRYHEEPDTFLLTADYSPAPW